MLPESKWNAKKGRIIKKGLRGRLSYNRGDGAKSYTDANKGIEKRLEIKKRIIN